MRVFILTALLFCSSAVQAQQFGNPVTAEKALDVSSLDQSLVGVKNLKLKGTIQEACQVKGCWMTMQLPNNYDLRVTFKDYGFFVPTDCSGKTAVIQGELEKQTIPVEHLKHLAKDAGRSETEIAAITQPSTELVFVADGVLLLEE